MLSVEERLNVFPHCWHKNERPPDEPGVWFVELPEVEVAGKLASGLLASSATAPCVAVAIGAAGASRISLWLWF